MTFIDCLQSASLCCYYICTSQLQIAESMMEPDITVPISQVRTGSERVTPRGDPTLQTPLELGPPSVCTRAFPPQLI